MTFTDETLEFWRGPRGNATPLFKAPRCGRGDFITAVIEYMSKQPYQAVDSSGNKLSLQEQLAEKYKRLDTKIITQLKSKRLRTFAQAMEVAPVMAFEKEDKIRKFISPVRKKDIRNIQYEGFHTINTHQNTFTGDKFRVYNNIIYF